MKIDLILALKHALKYVWYFKKTLPKITNILQWRSHLLLVIKFKCSWRLSLEIPLAWGYLCIVVSETANFLILHNRKFNFESKLQENMQSRKIKLSEKCFFMENHW